MANELGQSFAPLGDRDMQNRGTGNGAVSPVQEAIKTITTRLPRAIGAGGIAPSALLNSPGAAGLPSPTGFGMGGGAGEPSNPLLDALRRILGGMGGPMGMPSGFAMPNIPPPHVIPGVGEGEPIPGSFNPGGFDEEPPLPPPPPSPLGGRPPRDMGTPVGGINGRGRAYQA